MQKNKSEPFIKIKKVEVLSDKWRPLRNYTIEYHGRGKEPVDLDREVYSRGNGVAVLLYDLERRIFIMTRQFRLPSYLNGNESGLLTEVCAGLLDGDEAPEIAARREVLEETGYKLDQLQMIASVYMTPGADTELLYLFLAEVNEGMKIEAGGGVDAENEDIEVLHLDMDRGFHMLERGYIKDAKTMILLQHFQIKMRMKKNSK
jgi:nudix-type nucleoside diphosphatase (YffH/AdpP family)